MSNAELESRLITEQALLVREYPGFEMEVHESGTVYVHGWVGPNATLRGAYNVLVALPPTYGDGTMPVSHVVEPELRQGAPHTFTDGSLCLDHSGAFTRRSTLVTYLGWVSTWLHLYEDWLETGRKW